jgi:RNA polymerase sigma factor (sigma-70 family)
VPDTFLQPNAPEAPVVVKRATSVNIESAWQKYLLGGVEAKNELFAIVSRFMMMGARSRMIGLADIHDAPEDAAQKAAMAVLREIESFQGKNSKTGKSCSFYSWMRKIMSNKAADSLGKNIKTAKKRVPLMVYGEDGSVDDNPALYRDEHLQYLHKLPEFIKGADRLICSYIRQGLDYEQIGKTMGITEAGVKNRMARIRAKTHKLKLTR